jgi:DNA-binding MarR family transcriptional regulator
MSQHPESEPLDHLLAQVCRLHHARARTVFQAIGLYRGQPPVLQALHEQEGLTHSALAERLQVTPATITKMIQRMERAGFVTRRSDPEDQRVSRVYLTDAGRAIQSKVRRALRELEAEVFAGFTPEEQALAGRLLLRIRENLMGMSGEKPPSL